MSILHGFGVQDLGFGVQGLGFGVWGLWVKAHCYCSELRVNGVGFRVESTGRSA